LDTTDVTSGLQKGGLILINTLKDIHLEGYDVKTIDATGIALDVLGVPIVNTTMVGAFAGLTNQVSLESLKKAIKDTFPGKLGEKNAATAEKAYNSVQNL
jgi:pyruvate ferredoxin oxidoreductase gamma subunit